jgi:5-methylcytosine-specific restriction endonuclease McrA/lambda repressor-like predicted transcriptional regulator
MARAESKYSEDWIRENLDEGFEYISGFKNAHSHITIKGVECGHIFTKSMNTITRSDRKNPIICSECRRIAGEKRKERLKPKGTREQKKKRNDEIAELRKQGYTLKQLAEKYGMNDNTIGLICKEYGLNKPEYRVKGIISEEKREELRRRNRHSEDWVREKIDKGFEYVGGFKDVDSYITLKCKECGYIFERSFITIRKGRRTECPECKRMAKIQREIEQKEEAERRQREQTYNKLVKQFKDETNKYRHCKQTTMKTCKCCGNIFFTDKKINYCSKRCVNRVSNKNSEHARRTRMKEQMVDKDITIEGLYNRDNGKCALCGGKCEWDDYTKKDNYFIAGNFYPSIDHIIPLSKGGLHSWENVQLAHRICNTRKSNKSPLYV